MLRFLWLATRGYRLAPWRSPYLRWRIETYSGLQAEEIGFKEFRDFCWERRRDLVRFLVWASRMRRQARESALVSTAVGRASAPPPD